MSRNEGGPAFPQPIAYEHERRDFPCEFGMGGLTVRDYFAAKAMQSLILSEFMTEAIRQRRSDPQQDTAVIAYEYADAMLAEREK